MIRQRGLFASLLLLSGSGCFSGCLLLQDPPASFACESSSDCASDEKCKIDGFNEGRCVDKSVCAETSDCSPVEWCEMGTCRPRGCLSDGQCGYYACGGAAEEYQCYTICSASKGCGAGNACVKSACGPAECAGDGADECNGFECIAGVCGKFCAGLNTGCASADYVCKAGACVLKQ